MEVPHTPKSQSSWDAMSEFSIGSDASTQCHINTSSLLATTLDNSPFFNPDGVKTRVQKMKLLLEIQSWIRDCETHLSQLVANKQWDSIRQINDTTSTYKALLPKLGN
jgi:hypothetical protein